MFKIKLSLIKQKIKLSVLLFDIYFPLELAHKILYNKLINIYLFLNILTNHSLHISYLSNIL